MTDRPKTRTGGRSTKRCSTCTSSTRRNGSSRPMVECVRPGSGRPAGVVRTKGPSPGISKNTPAAFLLSMDAWLHAANERRFRAEILDAGSASPLRVVRFVLEDHPPPSRVVMRPEVGLGDLLPRHRRAVRRVHRPGARRRTRTAHPLSPRSRDREARRTPLLAGSRGIGRRAPPFWSRASARARGSRAAELEGHPGAGHPRHRTGPRSHDSPDDRAGGSGHAHRPESGLALTR